MNAMRRGGSSLLLAALAVLLVACASGDANREGKTYRGEVAAFDPVAQTITVETTSEGLVTMQYSDLTRLQGGVARIAEVQVGQRVVVHAWRDRMTSDLTVDSIEVLSQSPIDAPRSRSPFPNPTP